MIFLAASTILFSAISTPDVDWSIPERFARATVLNRAPKFGSKCIALTFDDGPDAKITPKVLDMLRANGVKATFFVLGPQARRHPALLRRMVAEGHVIGNHSWSHKHDVSKERAVWEIEKTHQAIAVATGVSSRLFRVPYGVQSGAYSAQAKAMGMTNVLWTRTDDDCYSDQVADMLAAIGTPRNGEIILCHDGPGKAKILKLLPSLLSKLKKSEYQFATIPELLHKWDTHLVAVERKLSVQKGPRVAMRASGQTRSH